MHKINNCGAIWLMFLLVFGHYITQAQAKPGNEYKVYHFTSAYTSFPESARNKGYLYDNVFFDAPGHYSDSSVLMVVPDKLKCINGTVDVVCWFHGWHNNIDTALDYYHLAKQFASSGKNAVLVLAEAAKNAPDSYGGKLEQPGDFAKLLDDVMRQLREQGVISKDCRAGNIVLAGHSGAYRVIAFMLQNGGVKVNEVDLFDALYGQTDKFLAWIKKTPKGKLVNLYTDSGEGTREPSEQMMLDLKKQGLTPAFTEEPGLTPLLLRDHPIVFIHSTREHNTIIFDPDIFKLFLENSPFLTDRK